MHPDEIQRTLVRIERKVDRLIPREEFEHRVGGLEKAYDRAMWLVVGSVIVVMLGLGLAGVT